jgi:hypothetical protein
MQNHKQQIQQIQLELPNYSYEYEQYLKKQEIKTQEETVIIIDIY